jgi:AraC-like DNA-binding protein
VGQITSLFVHKVIRQVDDGVDKHALLDSVGVDPEAPADPSVMVSAADYYAYFANAARLDPNGIALPLRTGASMRCDDYGAFGLAWKTAPTLRASCERAGRYARVLTSVATYEVHDDDDGAWMQLNRDGERTLGMRLSNEATIASIHAISQEVATDELEVLEVRLKHAGPDSTAQHEAHFGCPVHFSADRDAIKFSKASMAAPNRLGDPAVVSFFDTHLEEQLEKIDDDVSLERRVRIRISTSLSEGVPAVTSIASQLGMSGRTLQRRLSEQGRTFQQLVDDARRELAEKLLRETSYPLAEVAFLTGFSEQSAFNRAFKRWAGQTPRSYRIGAASAPD